MAPSLASASFLFFRCLIFAGVGLDKFLASSSLVASFLVFLSLFRAGADSFFFPRLGPLTFASFSSAGLSESSEDVVELLDSLFLTYSSESVSRFLFLFLLDPDRVCWTESDLSSFLNLLSRSSFLERFSLSSVSVSLDSFFSWCFPMLRPAGLDDSFEFWLRVILGDLFTLSLLRVLSSVFFLSFTGFTFWILRPLELVFGFVPVMAVISLFLLDVFVFSLTFQILF